MSNEKPQFNKSELLAELTNKHTAETSAKLDTLKQVGIETVSQLEKLNKNLFLKGISMIKGKDGYKGEKGEKGDDGKKGDKGEQGIKGKDGKDGIDGKDGKQGIQGIAGKNGEDGKTGLSGQDGSPDLPEDIKIKLESLKDDARLDATAIKNLPRARGGGGGISLLAVEQNFSKILDASGFGRTLSKTDDTNVTLTLGGSPTNALLRDTSLTLGWTGQLAVSRGGTAVSTFGGTNTILYTTATDTLSSIATANSGILVTSGAGVPSIATDIPTAVTIGTAYIYRVGGTDIALADGGTNASLTASNGGIFYSTATAGAILAGTATAGLALVSGASTTPSWFAPTAGSVLFAGVGGILQQDNANFFYDDATNFLGLGMVNPQNRLDVLGTVTTDQINLRSARAAIVSTDIIGGISFTSDDTTLTAPGTVVSQFRAVASATHTATVLDTDFVWRTTKGTTIAEVMRLNAIGTLEVKVQSVAASAETMAVFNVSDDVNSNITLANGSNVNGVCTPWLYGKNSGTNFSLIIGGQATTDTGTTPVVRFDARLTSAAVIAVRPVFVWNNYTTEVMRITANSDVEIGSTTAPISKLTVVHSASANGFNLSTAANQGLFMSSFNSAQAILSGGVSFDATNFTARSTIATIITQSYGVNGEIRFYQDLSLTSGNNYTPTERWRMSGASATLGNLSNTAGAGTAYIHLKAGTATVSTAPLKFTSGTNLTTPEAGAVEWNGTNLFITQTDGTRKTIAYV